MKCICENCGIEFIARHRRPQKCCSLACKTERQRTLDVSALRAIASTGATVERMARELNTTRQTVRFNLRRIGAHREWTLKRFKKAQVAA